VDGRHPASPWRPDELVRVLDAITRLSTIGPAPWIDALPSFVETFADDLSGWRELAGMGTVPGWDDPWLSRNLDRLAAIEATWWRPAGGRQLVHGDLRADNILLTDERVVFLDWPNACHGATWSDLVSMLPSMIMQGGVDAEQIIKTHPLTRDLAETDATALVVAVAGYFVRASGQPAPAGLPTVRGFQRAQGEAALRWIRQRLR
jgi:aminoglycoside phosphotransferase (APT) family kinase protein